MQAHTVVYWNRFWFTGSRVRCVRLVFADNECVVCVFRLQVVGMCVDRQREGSATPKSKPCRTLLGFLKNSSGTTVVVIGAALLAGVT